MKIEKCVNTDIDIEVDVSLEDIVCAIAEDTSDHRLVLRGINNAWVFLKAIPDEVIADMTPKQRETIRNAFAEQFQRFHERSGQTVT